MSWVLFSVLAALTTAMLAWGIAVRGHAYGYPFFAAAMFFTFVLPQMPGLINDRFLSEAGMQKTLFMSTMCLAMCGAGWAAGIQKRVGWDIAFSESRMLRVATGLSLLGAYFFYKFGQLPDEDRLRGMLTGAAVAYLFFAKLLTYGFALALLCSAHRASGWALAIILFDSVFYFERIVIAGRRGETAEFFLLVALAFWFRRGWAVPRVAVLAGIFASIIALLVASEYRQATWYNGEPNWSAVSEIDISRNWDDLVREGGKEMRNAVIIIDYLDGARTFDYGGVTWNNIVFTFIPAQLFGADFKQSLKLELPTLFPRDYSATLGSTETGMSDTFASFWYFGAFKFFVIGWLLGRIYTSAMQGNTAMQVTYMLSVVPSMLTITHFTDELTIAWVHMFAFLAPLLALARVPFLRPAELRWA